MSHHNLHFTQRRMHFLRRSLKVEREGVLNIVRQSPLEECEWQIDLSIVNPEGISRKSYSKFWLSLLIGSLFGMLIVLFAYKFNRITVLTPLDFIRNILIYAGGMVGSLLFYLRSKCDYTIFHYDIENEQFAFSLYTNKPNKTEFESFVKDLQNEIRLARINGKCKDEEQINSAIEFLYKDRVISDHVNSVLMFRLEDMDYFAN